MCLQVEEGTPLQLYIYWSDVAFTTIFGLEVLVKSFAFTFRLYIKEVTNQVGRGAVAPGVDLQGGK
jgi:hypothetical protein